MLVTLGTNQAIGSGASITLPYACRSLQKIFVKVDDTTGSQAWDHFTTVQLGSRTIANGITAWGLAGMQHLQGSKASSTASVTYCIDFGSHQLLDNENLYVTIRAASAIDAVDVSAVVDESTGGEFPVRYTEYSDNVFTAENVLKAISYRASRASVDEDNYNIEIRNAVTSSSPSLISCSNWFACSTFENGDGEAYGLLVNNVLPLTTTFNYSSSADTDTILVASQMGTNRRAINQGRSQKAIALSQVGK